MRLKYWLLVLITPSCWLQNDRYSSEWDERLRREMAKSKFELLGRYTARLGPIDEIWIANHPYASFSPYPYPRVRPSRATILMAWDRLLDDVFFRG